VTLDRFLPARAQCFGALALSLCVAGCLRSPVAATPAEPQPATSTKEPDLEPLAAILSEPDASGARTARIVFPDMPVRVRGGSELYLYRSRYVVSLPKGTHVSGVSSFIGVDRGDVVEVGVDLYSTGSYTIYQRGLHKESGLLDFDGWSSADADYTLGDPIVISLMCRVTGPNAVTGRLEANVLYEVRLSISPPSR
jgi:hypothetical protein